VLRGRVPACSAWLFEGRGTPLRRYVPHHRTARPYSAPAGPRGSPLRPPPRALLSALLLSAVHRVVLYTHTGRLCALSACRVTHLATLSAVELAGARFSWCTWFYCPCCVCVYGAL
jgi:hypothetical protein